MWLIVLFSLNVVCAHSGKLEDVFSWKQLKFQWPSEDAENDAIECGQYIPENNLVLGMDRWKNKLFLTVPRWKLGVPSTLTYVPIEACGKTISPALIPYPNLEDNTLPDIPDDYEYHKEKEIIKETSLISVFRVRVDKCDRLWVLDAGVIDINGNSTKLSNRALLIYDLNTDELIRRYTFRDKDSNDISFFTHMVLDSRSYNDTTAYISDPNGYGLVIYSFAKNESWRIKHNYFHNDPLAGQYNVGGVQFFWADGIFGVALSRIQRDGFRTAYFQPGASNKQFQVSTKVLSNVTYANSVEAFYKYQLIGDRGLKSECTSSFIDEKTGVLFYAELNKYRISCWNTAKPLTLSNIGVVEQNCDTLDFPDELVIDRERNLWILSNKMPKFLYKQLDPEEINFRLLKIKVDDAISGTACAIENGHWNV